MSIVDGLSVAVFPLNSKLVKGDNSSTPALGNRLCSNLSLLLPSYDLG